MIVDTPGRTHPIVRISRNALTQNLRSVPREVFADVSHDGWGHGAQLLTELAAQRGLAGTVTDGVATAFAGEVPPTYAMLTAAAFCGLLPETTPALTFSGTVLGTKPLRAGEAVSYGYTHRATQDTTIALVTGGYAQGLVRSLGNQLHVRVAGERRPIVGRVAMDVCVVDVGAVAVAPGSEVVFLGDPQRDEPGIAEWMALTGLTAEELILPIALRARREVLHD